jgi:hypothetical protein
MGFMRKMASISTLGAIKYTSKREAETKYQLQQAKLAKAQRKAVKRGVADEPDHAGNGQV